VSGEARTWGSTEEERAAAYPCDRWLEDADDELWRAIDVAAPPAVLFRWLCQLRAAPYSYDWIDNWGRRSPTSLTPGLDRLACGQSVMTVFRLVEFATDGHLTIVTRGSAILGRYAVTYAVEPLGRAETRLVAKIVACYPSALRSLLRRVFPAGDLLMMRKQLLTLKAYAERTAAAEA